MPIKEKTRAEIKDCYKWDLTLIYKNSEDWYQEYKELENKINEFSKYKGIILENPENLLKTLKDFLWLERRFLKLRAYTILKGDEDIGNTYYQKLKGEVENLKVLFLDKTSYVVPELIKDDYSKIEKYIEKLPELLNYRRMLQDIYRFKKYTLSEIEENLISKLSKLFSVSNNISKLLRNTDLTFEAITDEKGNLVELTNNNYNKYILSTNREVRKQAFMTLYKGYESVKNTLATSLAFEVEKNVALANLRGFSSVLESGLFDSNIDSKIYYNLIEVVNKEIKVLHKYCQLKKEHLDLEELTLYDIYIPMTKGINKTYEFEEAKEIIFKALSILGEDYLKNLNKAFSERWIDIYSNKGKRNGAYSCTCYDSRPYVFLNYQGCFNDILVLVHELGHSMHSYYSKKHNEYQDANYKIFIAEIVAIVNELLLYKYLLKHSTNKDEKLYILSNMLEFFRGKFFRQTMFAEFELEIHKRVSNNEILTHELLAQIYYDLNKKYFGPAVHINEEIKYEWARIHHFYVNFYVYQYATGISAACKIVNDIIENKENALNNYLEFLKTGNRDYPVELLKIAGVDISNPKVIKEAIKFFDDLVNEYIKLAKE